MRRALAIGLVALAACRGAAAQELAVLHLKVTVLNADRQPVPVARHALLISDNPATTVPRRVVTSAEGTAQIRLRPGNYTVESDSPFVLDGRTYEWVHSLDVAAGRDTTLELTADTAAGAVQTNVSDAAAAPDAIDMRASILSAWQESAFQVWTPVAYATGFLADERGLVATSLTAIGDAKLVEVQVSQSVKVTGVVILADASRDVAVVRVHPSAVDGIRAVSLACDTPAAASAEPGRYVIDVPLFGPKDIRSSLAVSDGTAGSPVFASDGRAVGLASRLDGGDDRRRAAVRVVGRDDVCGALASAGETLDASAPPDDTRLPVEPARGSSRVPTGADAPRSFSLAAYQLSSSDFDVLFLTPEVVAAAEARRGWTGGGTDGVDRLRLATDFEEWTDYVAAAPPLLFVRVSPRLVEGFWMKIARGALATQGAPLPPIKRLRPGFSRMRLVCGGRDVTPIHPFRIRARVSETDTIEEGFYVFNPDAISPDCGAVSIVLSSVKDPTKTETRTVDPAIVRQIWQDFGGDGVRNSPGHLP
jgi:hypothetical protein